MCNRELKSKNNAQNCAKLREQRGGLQLRWPTCRKGRIRACHAQYRKQFMPL